MAMAVAINTTFLALDFVPIMQEHLDFVTGGRFQIHRVSVYATIPFPDSEIWRQSRSAFHGPRKFDVTMAKREALDWQADPDDDLGDAAVMHHLHQQAATVPVLSSVLSQSDHSNAVTTLAGSALSASINAKTQGRCLSSFHRYSLRYSSLGLWKSISGGEVLVLFSDLSPLYPPDSRIRHCAPSYHHFKDVYLFPYIVCAGSPRDDRLVFLQLQVDVVDPLSRRGPPTSRPGKRQRAAFKRFLQLSDSPRRFNGVRYRPDRRTWVAEMKPPKHKTKQDFGNFKSEVEAAHAVDAVFHHYGRPDLLNFPDTSLQFLSTRPTAPPGLDEKAKVKFVKDEAKLLLAAIAVSSAPHSTHTHSLQILELSTSPRHCPSGYFRPDPLSEVLSPLSCNGPDEVDDAVSHPQPSELLDSICDISTTAVQTDLETLQNAEQGWNWAEDSSAQAAPPHVANPTAYKTQSMWLDSVIQSPPAPACSRSPSPSQFQEEIAYALLEQQGFLA